MSNTNELHVIFGSGPLGRWTMRELVSMDKRVRMVNRSGRTADVPAGVEIVQGDAYSTASTTQVSQGAVAVYQCAQPPYHEWPEKFPRLQSAILEGAAANGAKLIVGDNLYMYGDTNGKPINEATPITPHTSKGRVRAQMADAVLEAHRSGKVRAAIGRASNFFGPYEQIVSGLVFYPALAGKTVNVLGRLDQPHSFSYAPDFGKGLAILGTHDEALGQVWITPCSPPVTQQELVTLLSKEVGHPVKARAGGKLILSLMGLFNPTLRETIEMLYEWEKPFIVDSSKFERAFGVTATPLETAVRETLAWCRSHPQTQQAAGV
jgi:nucleoside-diphosphate-sugar epimerase